jgi:hypothetical protein
MKKAIAIFLCIFLFPFSFSYATPPTSITLTYDIAKGSLHVEAIHPSFDLEKSYVRLMNVYVNGNQVSSFNYFKQTDNNEFTDDVAVTAQTGDVIKVELFCALGGDMSKELTVQAADAAPADQGASDTTTNSEAANSAN